MFKKRIKKNLRKLITPLAPHGFYWKQKGFCPICEKNVSFISLKSWLRDYFRCSNCFSIPRQRALMVVINKYYPNWRELKIHESSPGSRGASLKIKNECNNYISTQYFPTCDLGSIINNFRNEDLENQTFPDKSFDIVITQDVLEHVYNPKKVFQEISRTLKSGGAHIFTVPLVNRHNKSEIWATKGDDGKPVF